ncbi:MAG TPA: DegT/DnrJ/EryC1/StrS aminotransferase family protein [Candidatus Dorea intestinavium]|nr:DegT/DnrJ/EryC1/StrS aminotransferase family protein [Candidatus Dorea intestinavium]
MNIPFSPPDITEEEIEAVSQTLRSGWITTGPKTKEIEKIIANNCQTNKAAALNSATAALELSLRLLGIKEGDEVITTAYTYTATASAAIHVGATVKMVDTFKDSFDMDYTQIAGLITEKTKAIICVDLAGIIYPYYEEIYKIIEAKRNLFQAESALQEKLGRIALISDSAHAFGATRNGVSCGSISDFSSFSFHAVKNLTTGEGGALTWKKELQLDDENLYKQLMLLSLHGQSKDALAKTKAGSWEYDIVAPLYKCNMTDICASIGVVQAKRYPQLLARRKEIINRYHQHFANTSIKGLNHYTDNASSSGHLYIATIEGVTLETRNKVIEEMGERGIATNVHYKPLPLLSAYKNLGFDIKNYPNAYHFFEQEITLPLHTLLRDEEVDYVAQNLLDIVEK